MGSLRTVALTAVLAAAMLSPLVTACGASAPPPAPLSHPEGPPPATPPVEDDVKAEAEGKVNVPWCKGPDGGPTCTADTRDTAACVAFARGRVPFDLSQCPNVVSASTSRRPLDDPNGKTVLVVHVRQGPLPPPGTVFHHGVEVELELGGQIMLDDAPLKVVTKKEQRDRFVGSAVTLEGVVSNTKLPTILGVDVETGSPDLRGKRARASGVLRKSVVTAAHLKEGEARHGIVANRGPGTFYHLEAHDGRGLARATPIP